MAIKKVYFVRHGEAAGNVEGFSQVATTPLTEVGHHQASVVAERFRSIPVELVCASYYDRAQETARYIAAAKNIEVQTLEDFHEWVKPSSVQGQPHDSETYQVYQKIEAENYTDPSWRFEDGENFSDILTRVETGVAKLESVEETNIVAVSHGRLLRFITTYLLLQKDITAEIEWRASLKANNTGVTLFEYDGSKWLLRTYNDIAHFAE